MPVTDFKALRCQSARQMVGGGKNHSGQWGRAALQAPPTAFRPQSGRGRAPPRRPPLVEGRLLRLCTYRTAAHRGDSCAFPPAQLEPKCKSRRPPGQCLTVFAIRLTRVDAPTTALAARTGGQTVCDYRNAESKVGHNRRAVPDGGGARKAEARRRAPYIYLARDSRARWAVRMCADVAGFRFTWPGKECFCRAGRLQDWEAVSHAVRETTNTSTAAAKGFALDRQTACDYPNAEPKVGHDRRDVLVGGGARKAKARRRAPCICLARVSRARVGLCGCVRMWPVFGSLGPARNSSAGPDDFEDGKQCLMQSMTQPTPCPLPRKAAGLTVGLRAITGMRTRSLATGFGPRPESPRTLEGEARSRANYIYIGRVSRPRALPCTDCTDSA